MKFFRNGEVVKTLAVQLVLTAAAIAIASVLDKRFGFFVGAVSLLFTAVYLISTHKRYKRIYELSAEIDSVLHGGGDISPGDCREGELAVLKSEIHKMTVRLAEQNRLLQKDKVYLSDMIADISHQIRTPLTSINLILSLLSEPDIKTERRAELTRELARLLSRIDWLITSLLKLSRLDAGTVSFGSETVTLEKLVADAVAPLSAAIDLRGQNLTVSASGNFTGDTGWTAEAIGNIVKNCMEHTPDGGEITVTASENAIYSEITISDNGPGISGEDLPRIFERFYKGGNSGTGFGIGLALARTVIAAQNGTVKAENRRPTGAMFTVRFYKGTV